MHQDPMATFQPRIPQRKGMTAYLTRFVINILAVTRVKSMAAGMLYSIFSTPTEEAMNLRKGKSVTFKFSSSA